MRYNECHMSACKLLVQTFELSKSEKITGLFIRAQVAKSKPNFQLKRAEKGVRRYGWENGRSYVERNLDIWCTCDKECRKSSALQESSNNEFHSWGEISYLTTILDRSFGNAPIEYVKFFFFHLDITLFSEKAAHRIFHTRSTVSCKYILIGS